jgi:hypothetical protein
MKARTAKSIFVVEESGLFAVARNASHQKTKVKFRLMKPHFLRALSLLPWDLLPPDLVRRQTPHSFARNFFTFTA